MHPTKKEIFSIPNLMGYFRLLLVPVYLVLYFRATDAHGYLTAAAVLAVSALTDMFDGKIARRFHMVTELGKILDPIADKVTHGAVALSLTFRFPLMRYVFLLFVVKEAFMGFMGLYMIKRRGTHMDGAQWYGKLCTAVLFLLLLILLLDVNISWFMAGVLCILCIAVMLFSLCCYIIFYACMLRGVPLEENKISIRRVVLTFTAAVLLLLIYDLSIGLSVYSEQPSLSAEHAAEIEEQFGDWKAGTQAGTAVPADTDNPLTGSGGPAQTDSESTMRTGSDGTTRTGSENTTRTGSDGIMQTGSDGTMRTNPAGAEYGESAAVIEDNGQALLERVRLIEGAKERIILSTFDFHSDESGKIMLGALLSAADRDVEISVLVDGSFYWLHMEWNPYFYALSSHENVTLKVYNLANPLVPWRSMGRLHDKYLIADDAAYLLGGRNTYDYFLGDTADYRNYDRDVLVRCDGDKTDSSLVQLEAYFNSIWEYDQTKTVHDEASLSGRTCVKRARRELDAAYDAYRDMQGAALTDTSLFTRTYPVSRIAFISNPIHTGVKEPYAWHALMTLMSQAEERVKIHTPYIICNEMMYDSLNALCNAVPHVTLMTNSAANNGNPFGASDYAAYKDRILATGLSVWEYEGGCSYHGKSMVIDDDIAIVGSFNLDMRSVYLDTELMVVIQSKDVCRQLTENMEFYEHSARHALADGSYENPYGVVPVELTSKRAARIFLIRRLALWARYLF